ncbi:MAG TPA: hypothetical protein VEI02_05150, partial [Planctomycetota bacterium]|nr:hypothetical protein [Planctomycetota bacterium]
LWSERHRAGSRVAAATSAPYGAALLALLRFVRPTVLAGGDDTYFRRERLSDRRGPVAEIVREVADRIVAVDRRFRERGTRLVVCCTAEKDLVCPDLLPRGAATRPELYVALLAELARRDVFAADVLGALTAARREGVRVYARNDSHWTYDGVLAAAEEIARVAGARTDPATRRTRMTPRGVIEDVGDVLTAAGVDVRGAPTSSLARRLLEMRRPVLRLDRLAVVDDAGVALLEEGPPVNTRDWWLCGTSFSAYIDPILPHALMHVLQAPVRYQGLVLIGEGAAHPLMASWRAAGIEGFPQFLVWEFPSAEVFARGPVLRGLDEFFAIAR